MTVLLAFTVEHAAKVTGVSERRIRYWDRTGVLSPSLLDDERGHAYNRVYSFRDLVGLRTLGILRDDFDLPLQKLRLVGTYLTRRYDAPWSELRFHVMERGRRAEILFRDPDSGQLLSAVRPGQATLFEIEPIARDVEREAAKLAYRDSDHIGRVVRHRYVLGNRPTIAGTRVPTAAIWEFDQAGYSTEEIIREYPRLTLVDVCEAIAFERESRASTAS